MARGHYDCSCCDGTGECPDCDVTGEIPGLMTMKLPPNHPKLGALEKLQDDARKVTRAAERLKALRPSYANKFESDLNVCLNVLERQAAELLRESPEITPEITPTEQHQPQLI